MAQEKFEYWKGKDMTQEEEQLLLKDICARLPYRLKGIRTYKDTEVCELRDVMPICKRSYREGSFIEITVSTGPYIDCCDINQFIPYLRPIASMTEDEKKEYHQIILKSQECSFENGESAATMVNDWLLSKCFDVHGLIPKRLAIEAFEGLY